MKNSLLILVSLLSFESFGQTKVVVTLYQDLDHLTGVECPHQLKGTFWSPDDSIKFHGDLQVDSIDWHHKVEKWSFILPSNPYGDSLSYQFTYENVCPDFQIKEVVFSIPNEQDYPNEHFRFIRYGLPLTESVTVPEKNNPLIQIIGK